MSLYIDVDRVTQVLLADKWLPVADGSFNLDSYEFHYQDNLLHGGGNSGVSSTGFVFKSTDGDYVAGPLTAIKAVRYKQDEES
ncbi:hypothetical protein ACIRL0_06585 [Streptomyces sp. NPDC102365]|uniref:hypothetical protein n=1 Tax=Streptomyces sp. NPDC102365 TaxID=3366162 RepID=UPI003819FB01